MKNLFFLIITIFLIFNTAFAEELLDTSAAGQEASVEATEEILYTPAPEEILYSPVAAPEKPAVIFHAAITAIFQTVDLNNNSSKAQEYRKLTDGLYIKDLSMRYESPVQEFTGSLRNVSPLTNMIDDGYGDLTYNKYGIVDVNIGVDKYPHIYANDAESIFIPVNEYTFRMPAVITGAEPFEARTQRDNYNLNVRFTPDHRLTLTSSLSVENRKGRRPLSLENLTGLLITPTAITEIAEPTDYTTAIFSLGLEYADEVIDLQLNNNVQVFANTRPDKVIWDNPWQSGAYGQAKVADDYTVHTLSLKPSIKISDKIRMINSLSYSRVTNSIKLAPFTTVDGVGIAFQKDVLDPDVRTLSASSILTTIPHPDIRVNMKYRYFTYENDTPKIEDPPAYVMLDGSSTKYIRRPRYTTNITSTAGIDGNWYLSDRLSIDGGIENKDIPRSEREVAEQNIKSLFITVNSSLYRSLSAYAGYKYEMARGDYDATYYKTIYDPLSDVDQHKLLRAFDLSESDVHTAKAGINYFPFDTLNLSASFSISASENIDVSIGRNHYQKESASISAEYTPLKDLLLYSNYFYNRTTVESVYSWTYDSTLSASYPSDPNPLYSGFIKPISETIEDTANSYTVGFDYMTSDKISVMGNYSRHDYTGKTATMPAVSSTTDVVELKISYKRGLHIKQIKDLRISAGYYAERYRRNDYALDNIPEPADVIVVNNPEDIYLGISEPDYKLSILSLTLDFYF